MTAWAAAQVLTTAMNQYGVSLEDPTAAGEENGANDERNGGRRTGRIRRVTGDQRGITAVRYGGKGGKCEF